MSSIFLGTREGAGCLNGYPIVQGPEQIYIYIYFTILLVGGYLCNLRFTVDLAVSHTQESRNIYFLAIIYCYGQCTI